ncbi:MAG: S41 family peptidase [Patescibacteria group bacterium]
MQNKFVLPSALIIALVIGFGGGMYFQKSRATTPALQAIVNQDGGKPDGVDFAIFWDAWNLLQKNYVDKSKLDTQKLVYGAIDGLVNSIGDPYTVFFPPKESKAFAEQIKGAFGGVGIEIGNRENVLTVIAPIKDSPAERAGIRAGDKITKIDGTSTEGISVEEAVGKIRGTKGTTVTLSISRESAKDLKDYKLTRDTIKIPAVAWKMLDGNVAHLQVYVFNQNVDDEFKKAADEISRSSATRIVLDLRNNPGGLLDSAVSLSSYFLDAGKVVTTEKFGNGLENAFKTEPNGKLKSYPLVILINKGSASASEILAGALHDQRQVTLVGETSFGKGSVQQIDELGKGSSLKITIAKWYTPNGVSINENGIKPTVEVERSDEDYEKERDPQLDKALEIIKNL